MFLAFQILQNDLSLATEFISSNFCPTLFISNQRRRRDLIMCNFSISAQIHPTDSIYFSSHRVSASWPRFRPRCSSSRWCSCCCICWPGAATGSRASPSPTAARSARWSSSRSCAVPRSDSGCTGTMTCTTGCCRFLVPGGRSNSWSWTWGTRWV